MALSSGLLNSLGTTRLSSTTKDEDPLAAVDTSIANSTNRLATLGVDAPKPRQSFLVSVLKNLGRTGYAANNLIREFSNPEGGATPGQFDPGAAFKRGLTLEEHPWGKDVMQDLGMEGNKGVFGGENHWYNPSPAGAAGLALDVLNPLDVVNWLGLGVGKAAMTGGLKGTQALEKAFGTQGAKIAEKLGTNAAELGAPSVGKLMKQITQVGKEAGMSNDALNQLIVHMTEGMGEAGTKATSRLKYWSARPLTVGFQNPLTLGFGKMFMETPIKGSEKLTAPISKGWNKFMETKVGDALGKAFSNKHVPTTVPDSVIIKDITTMNLDNMIKGGVHAADVPLNSQELTALKDELAALKPMGTQFDRTLDIGTAEGMQAMKDTQKGMYSSFDEVAGRTGLDSTFSQLVFEHNLPFTMDIQELYKTLQKTATEVGESVDNKVLFQQAARMRKTMDLMAENIPQELRQYFKGTVLTPSPIHSYEGSPLQYMQDQTTSSPMMNYVFDLDGVSIFVGVNTGKSFNDNVWSKLGATLKTLQGMPKENLNALRQYIQISPVELGKEAGQNVSGYATHEGMIVLGDISPYVTRHEYGHVWDKAAAPDEGAKYFSNMEGYASAADQDLAHLTSRLDQVHPEAPDSKVLESVRQVQDMIRRGENPDLSSFISDYARQTSKGEGGMHTGLAEDFADSVSMYLKEPAMFKEYYPNRAAMIEEVLAKTQTNPEELAGLIKAQGDRAAKMAQMESADKQVQELLDQVDAQVTEHMANPTKVAGVEAYREFREQLTELFESSAQDVEAFTQQVEAIFKDLSVEERKQIMEIAAGGYLKEPSKVMQPKNNKVYLFKNDVNMGTVEIPWNADKATVDQMVSNYAKKYNVEYDAARMRKTGSDEMYDVSEHFAKPMNSVSGPAPTFYSKLSQVVDEKMANAMPVQDLRNMLKSAGVKDEEMKWMGLNDFLEGKVKVSKTEVQELLKMNNLEVKEIIKAAPKGTFSLDEWSRHMGTSPDDVEEGMRIFNRHGREEATKYLNEASLEPSEVEKFLDSLSQGSELNINPPQYGQYTVPGGEDYKELLFTLPGKKVDKTLPTTSRDLVNQLNDIERQIANFTRGTPEYQALAIERDEITRQITRVEDNIPKTAYQSAHWDEPNVVAHTRFDTRTAEDGSKVLFVQEIQSDWHQAGRQKGYKKDLTPEQQALVKRQKQIDEELDHIPDDPSNRRRLQELTSESTEIDALLKETNIYGVEHAPFEKTWPDFVMKRLIRYAADNGYDRIAWTTGKQQAERYSLSQSVDKLIYSPTGTLTATKNGNQVFFKQGLKDEELADYVGKEVALKLTSREAESTGNRVLEGLDLDMGGEGMKGFYDKMVPQMFEKYTKKWGAKLENIKLGSVGKMGEDAKMMVTDLKEVAQDLFIQDSVKNSDELLNTIIRGTGAYFDGGDIALLTKIESEQISKSWVDEWKHYATQELGKDPGDLTQITRDIEERLFKEFGNKSDTGEMQQLDQMSIRVTDSMKKEVIEKGQPLFAKGADDTVTDPAKELSEQGQAALDAFTKWRESVAKQYKDLQIPMNELENYVPFIPVRGLKKDEQAALQAAFGTGVHDPSQSVDDLLAALSRTDPNLKERTTKARSPAEVNKLLGKEWLTEDAALAMAMRGTRAIKAKEVATFLTGFLEKYGLSAGDIAKMAEGIPQGYKMFIVKTENNGRKTLQEVFNAPGIAAKDIKGFFLPEDMAKVYNEYSELVFGSSAKNPILKIYDAATAAYKKVAYLWNPGHIPRDFIGNVFNGYLMGVVNPMEYIRAAGMLRNPTQEVVVNGTKITVQELLEKARKFGVLDVGAYAGETPRDILDRLALKGGNPIINLTSKYSNLMRQGTKKADTLTRFTALMHELDSGKNFTEASAQVKKFMFDYFDLTPFERKVMKRIMPFYTWMRKNIPLQLEMVARNPRAYSRIESTMNAAQGGDLNWEDRPGYINDSGAVQLGSGGDYAAPALPYTDLARTPTNLKSLLSILSGVNPIIRAPVEMATNTQWFTGRPLEDYQGQSRDMPLAGLLRMLGVNTPSINKRVTGTALDQIPLLRNIDVMTNPENPDKQTSRTSSFLGGPSIYTQEGVEKSKAYEEKRALDALIRKLNDEGTVVPTTKEIKKGSTSKGKFDYLKR